MSERPTVRVHVGDLQPGQTRVFEFEREGEDLSGIAMNHEGAWVVYVNRCPHVWYSLDFGDGDVLDPSRKFLMCMSHGAMFLPESGECFMGPAVGSGLEKMPFEVDGDDLVVTIPPEPGPGEWP